MSHIFRSDRVQLGERVVVRRQYPAADGGRVFSDVIGHVVALDPLTVRPQEVGGYPSDLDAVTIKREEIYVVKRLSPRRIRNSDIRHVETAYAKAFPGISQQWTLDGQWLLRAGDGITERSNSATPLGRSAGFGAVPIDEITDFYTRHDLPVRLHIPERIGSAAERLVTANSGTWEVGPEILVMTRALHDLPSVAAPDGLSFHIDDYADDDWLSLYHFRGQPLPARALQLLHDEIDGTMGFGCLRTSTGETVAITRATITTSDDGTSWLGYSAVEVAKAYRRRGLGTLLGTEILRWGSKQGADNAYLQVISTNHPGIALYEKLGFIEHHRHAYATRR